MESIFETKAVTILQFVGGVRGSLQLIFEEGTWGGLAIRFAPASRYSSGGQRSERRHENRMNREETKTPKPRQHEIGWKVQRTFPLLPVAGQMFLLTFPFIEPGYRPS